VTEQRPVEPMDRFMGAAIMAIGLLITGLCGTCTAYFTFAMGGGSSGGALISIIMVLLVGGTPTLIGIAMFRFGLKLYRGTPVKPPLSGRQP